MHYEYWCHESIINPNLSLLPSRFYSYFLPRELIGKLRLGSSPAPRLSVTEANQIIQSTVVQELHFGLITSCPLFIYCFRLLLLAVLCRLHKEELKGKAPRIRLESNLENGGKQKVTRAQANRSVIMQGKIIGWLISSVLTFYRFTINQGNTRRMRPRAVS